MKHSDEVPKKSNAPEGIEKEDEVSQGKLEDTVENLQEQLAEYEDLLKRNRAEFLNYKKRTEAEQADLIKYAQGQLILRLLPVLDSFEHAFKSDKDPEKFRQGMEMVWKQFSDILKNEGLKEIECLGKEADPYLHEVLMKEESQQPEDIIIEEFQKGYSFHSKALRHSKVKVSKHAQEDKPQ